MKEIDLEGSLIMEKLAELGLEDDFMEAVDADDIVQVVKLLREADIEEGLIRNVLQELA